MSTSAVPTRRLFSLRRFGFPLLVVMLAVVAIAILWLSPGLAPDSRAGNTFFISIGTIAALTVWLVAFSGLRWYLRLAVVVVEAAVTITIQPHLVFDGDMVPHIRSLLENHAEMVEQNRREQANAAFAAVEISDRPTDWPEYRGRRRDGIVHGPKLSRGWKKSPPRLVWKQPCGEGFGSFAVAGTLAITLEQRRKEFEAIVAYDAGSGHEVWKYEYAARFYEPLGGLGPRSTPTISDGEVFSLGATGQLVCLDAKTGAHKWTVDILDGGSNLQWGMSASPLVVGDRVIVAPGNKNQSSDLDRALFAYDRHSHQVIWTGLGKKGGYSSPMSATIGGVEQVIVFGGEDIAGYDLDKGTRLWSYDWPTYQDINVAQPIVWDSGQVFVSSGYGVGCAMLRVEKANSSAQLIWRKENKPIRAKLSNCVEGGGFIYGLDEGFLACIDAKDGGLLWREGRYGHGQLLRQDDLLIILDERGNLVLLDASPNGYREIGKMKAIKSERTWNVPAMVDGRIFVRNDKEMACFDLRDEK